MRTALRMVVAGKGEPAPAIIGQLRLRATLCRSCRCEHRRRKPDGDHGMRRAALTSAALAAVWLLLLATSGLSGCTAWAVPADDRAASVGMWDVVSVEVNGKQVDPELVALLQVAYRADGSWSVLFKGLPLAEGTSTNDETATPKTFEMDTLAGEHATPLKYTGIYRLEDDTRQFCFVEADQPRPDTFTAPRGSRRVLVTLRRAARR